MEDWTPEAIRGWILEYLYEIYMDNSLDWAIFNIKPSDEPTPPFLEIVRETELLEHVGHVEILIKTSYRLHARLTINGRMTIEQSQHQPPAQEREPLGFETEE